MKRSDGPPEWSTMHHQESKSISRSSTHQQYPGLDHAAEEQLYVHTVLHDHIHIYTPEVPSSSRGTSVLQRDQCLLVLGLKIRLDVPQTGTQNNFIVSKVIKSLNHQW